MHCLLGRSWNSRRHHRACEARICLGLVSHGTTAWAGLWAAYRWSIRRYVALEMGLRLFGIDLCSGLLRYRLLHA